jgi:hypothetical protein
MEEIMKSHRRPLFAFSILVLLGLACSIAVPSTPTSTPAPTTPAIVFHTVTPGPTETKAPAASPTLAGEVFAWNNLGEIDSGGLKIQIARVMLGEKKAINQPFEKIRTFDDRPVVVALIFKIINTSSDTLSVYPDQGTVVAAGEQVDLGDFMLFGTFGDDIGGDIFPGVTKIGGIWLGFKRTSAEAIQNLTLVINAPMNKSFIQVGGDYQFNLDLSDRKLEPVPPELESLK